MSQPFVIQIDVCDVALGTTLPPKAESGALGLVAFSSRIPRLSVNLLRLLIHVLLASPSSWPQRLY